MPAPNLRFTPVCPSSSEARGSEKAGFDSAQLLQTLSRGAGSPSINPRIAIFMNVQGRNEIEIQAAFGPELN